MHSRPLFFAQFGVLAIVSVTHVVATLYALYWHYIWLDLPVHFMGGMWAALVFAWIALLRSWKYADSFAVTLVFVLAVSIAWELFELFVGVPREANFAFDTSLDLTMDITGGVIGYALARALT